jgi:hypothetical protein
MLQFGKKKILTLKQKTIPPSFKLNGRSLSSSIVLSNLGGTVDNSEKYANHISSSILYSGLSLLDSRREFSKFQYSFGLFD